MRAPVDLVSAVVLACTALACLTAGLGMLVTVQGLPPWNGIAVCLIVTGSALGWRVRSSVRGHRVRDHR